MEKFRLGALVSVDTRDFEEFCDFAAGWDIDHQLIGRTRPRMTVAGLIAPGLQLALVEQAAPYSSQGQNPTGMISVAVSLDQRRPMIHRGHSLDQLQVAITRTGEGFELLNRVGAQHFLVSFSQARLEQYAVDVWHDSRLRLRFPDLAHRMRYIEACETILNDVQKQPALLADARAVALLEEKLVENLLLHGYADSTDTNYPSRYHVARRAYRYLLDHLEEVVSIRDLCAVTGASYMTLERGFRETYGMAPQAYIKALRLSRARKELLHPALTTTVTDVALHWGFIELGRFSVQYRQRFGESPSETLRKARGDRWRVVGD
ncbi:MAG: helix-turn-helix transcriptional regulator [Acidobacteriaceae bacterium]|nr:helix-turn-helix transcriptional regulator [Acidobacteriaceae bacterium]